MNPRLNIKQTLKYNSMIPLGLLQLCVMSVSSLDIFSNRISLKTNLSSSCKNVTYCKKSSWTIQRYTTNILRDTCSISPLDPTNSDLATFVFWKGLRSSVILANDTNYLNTLSKWLTPVVLNQAPYWKKCWRASADGWASTTFHSLCDSKGPTVTIIRVGKYIFGGYTSTSWSKWMIDKETENLQRIQNLEFDT